MGSPLWPIAVLDSGKSLYILICITFLFLFLKYMYQERAKYTLLHYQLLSLTTLGLNLQMACSTFTSCSIAPSPLGSLSSLYIIQVSQKKKEKKEKEKNGGKKERRETERRRR